MPDKNISNLAATDTIGWEATTYFAQASGVVTLNGDFVADNLVTDAANDLVEVRNSTAAQSVRVFGSYTDAANNEYIEIGHDGTNAYVRTGSLGTGDAGQLTLPGLPTSDPTVAGALWNDSGTLKISAG